jgi:hypothetical protein
MSGRRRPASSSANSEDADNLTLHPHKEDEFWLWVNSWAAFVQRPSDLGLATTPAMSCPSSTCAGTRWRAIIRLAGEEKGGQGLLLKRDAIGVVDASAREARQPRRRGSPS